MKKYEIEWQKKARARFVGKRVVIARWMTKEEAEASGWRSRPMLLVFDDGTWVCSMADNEGNNGGAFADADAIWPTM